MSSSSTSSNASTGMTIDIRPLIEDVSQVMTKHITNILTGVIGDYTVYKETHNTIMSLPCVRKLQDRISELEVMCNSTGTCGGSGVASGSEGGAVSSHTREEEVAQLQSAIVELNRYIQALEAKVDMKSVAASACGGGVGGTTLDEEAIKLEIHEDDADAEEENNEPTTTALPTSQMNKIVSINEPVVDDEEGNVDANAEEDVDTEEDANAEADAEEDEAEEEADAEDVNADADAEEAEEETEEEVEEDAEEEKADADAEEAEEDEEEKEDADAEVEADADEEAEEEADADEEEAEEEAEEAEEAEEEADADAEEEEDAKEEEVADDEIEVSEVKIKGKTYFTTDPQNGIIYACVDDDVGDEVGVFKNGIAVFNKGKK